MASSVWIKLSLFLYAMSVSQTTEGKKFHRTSLSKHPFRSGRRSGFSKGNFLEVNKKSRGFAKKSVAPFHVEGNPLVHLSVVAPKRESQGDNAPAAQPQRGSFKIDDNGVIGGGTYEINEDGVDVDINLKIGKKPAQEPKPQGPPPGETTPPQPLTPKLCPMPCPQPSTPKLCPMPCPQPGQPSPAKPEGSQAKPVPAEQPGSTPSPSGPGSSKPGTTPSPLEPASSKPGSPTTPVEIGGYPHEAPTPVPGTAAGPTTPNPETTQPAAGGEAGSDFATEGLNEHNKFRKVHGVPPLTLNAEMSQEAEAYAQKIAQMGSLQHASRDERKGYGENLSMGCSSSKGGQTATEAVTNWYNEVCSPGYSFGSDSGAGGTGHFTQVVWKESKELGMGKADSEENGMKCTYIVGRYNPAGNMMGAYADNVPKGSFDQSYCSSIQEKRSDNVWKTTSSLDADSWLLKPRETNSYKNDHEQKSTLL